MVWNLARFLVVEIFSTFLHIFMSFWLYLHYLIWSVLSCLYILIPGYWRNDKNNHSLEESFRRSGLELMDMMSVYQEGAYERLCRWGPMWLEKFLWWIEVLSSFPLVLRSWFMYYKHTEIKHKNFLASCFVDASRF